MRLAACMDGEIESVAKSANADFQQYEVVSVTILKFKDGRVGKVAFCIDCPALLLPRTVGSEGSLLDNKFHSMQLGGLNKGKWSELSMKMLDSGDVSDHPYQTQFGPSSRRLKTAGDAADQPG
jgi:hypothetical protein